MARQISKEKGNQPKDRGNGKATAKQTRPLVNFHKFPELPIELRLMIIEDALQEDQKGRPARVILFDHHTYRISPLLEQSRDLPPILFVDTQFRKAALKIYVMLDVIEVGVPCVGDFGDEEQWHNEDGELKYSLEIAQMIDIEANGGGLFYEGPKGHLYIRPATDIFLTGLVPRQINNTPIFGWHLDALDDGPNESWSVPICYVTERLPLAACAQITTMCDLVWDPGCPSCGECHPIHCRECFLEGRGEHLADPEYDAAVYPSLKDFGIYLMGGDHIPETLMYRLAVAEHPTKEFLDEMDDSYVEGFPFSV